VKNLFTQKAARGAHPGGRNRLFLDGHTEFLKDARTPRN
jgi:prepilin-type processing-associated H-X9-DG protein